MLLLLLVVIYLCIYRVECKWLTCESVGELLRHRAALSASIGNKAIEEDVEFFGTEMSLIKLGDRDAAMRYMSVWQQLSGHDTIAAFRGSCLDASTANAGREKAGVAFMMRDRLLTWKELAARELSWCQRLHIALTTTTLLAYLEGDWDRRNPKTARNTAILCDFEINDVGFTSQFDARLTNFVSL
jgi:hypothetical protein